MKINEWFDPNKIEHLVAYNHLRNYGEWQKEFLPKDVEFPIGWQFLIMAKITNEYINEKLKIGKK